MSAVVLSYNGRQLLEVVLPSLAVQTRPADEVIVVDNGSSDDTSDWLAADWPEIRVVRIPSNVGVAAALNRGVRAARGEFVALLNNDIELDPDWLHETVAGLIRHPDAAAVACKLRSYRDRARLDGAGVVVTRWMTGLQRGHGELDEGQYDREEETLMPTAGAALYRASAFSEVGLFDESFWAYFEDVDWGLRAQLAGLRSWYLPKAVAYHMGSATTGGIRDAFYLTLHYRNRFGLIVKDVPLHALLSNLSFLVVHERNEFRDARREKRMRIFVRSRVGAVRQLPGWLRQRWRIQRSRRVPSSRIQELLSD